MKKVILCSLMVVYVLTLVSISVFSQETVKIGIILPLSGHSASIGVNSLNGHKLAVEEINEAGGIHSLGGAKLELIIADSGSDPKVGMTQAERLISKDEVVAIIGAYNSSVTFPTTQVAEKMQIPYLVPSSYLTTITERGFKYTFRLCLSADWACREEISFLDRMGRIANDPIKTVGLVYENSDSGQSWAEGWKKYIEEYDFEVVLDESYPANAPSLDPVILKMKSVNPDALLFSSYVSDAILLTQGMAEKKIQPKVIVTGAGGFADPVFFENVGANADYIFDIAETSPDIDLPLARETNAKYKEIYNVDMSDDCIKCYTATYVMAKALEMAKSTDPNDIQRMLANMLMIPGQKGIITPYAIEFGPDGQNIHARTVIIQNLNQQRVVVYPVELALPGAEIVWPMPSWDER